MKDRLHYRYRALPLLALGLLLVLFTACTSGGVVDTNGTATPSSGNIASLGSTTDTCPSSIPGSGCMTPHALRVAYGIEPLLEKGYTGKGQTVIDIVSFGSSTLQQDVNAFDSYYHLPPITIQIIAPLHEQEYDPYGDKPGWGQETTLDVEIIHALAPGANIVVLESPVAETEGTVGLPEFRQLIQYALDHHTGNIISQSWGASEATFTDSAGQQEIQKWDALYKQATTQDGLTILTASGDHGSTDAINQQGNVFSKSPTTSFAADDPWVTTVGGTSIRKNGGTYSETVWNSSNGAGGGGFSKFFPEPSYQQTLPSSVQSELNNRRGVPDVSADADPDSAMSIYVGGQWTAIGGTSASTPMWASIVAIGDQLAGHPLGFINPGLYKIAQSSSYNQDFHDITSGNNSLNGVPGYNATQGWDASSGLGSPDATTLLPALINALK